MISINKEEAEMLRKRFKDITIVRTMKRKSERHKYMCEETNRVLKYLAEIRNKNN